MFNPLPDPIPFTYYMNQNAATPTLWPDPPAWHPSHGLMVWDGDIYYRCQQALTGKFVCGKCMWHAFVEDLITKPGDVCPECFSVAIASESEMDRIVREAHEIQMEQIMRQTKAPWITFQQTMTKEEFAKLYPPKP